MSHPVVATNLPVPGHDHDHGHGSHPTHVDGASASSFLLFSPGAQSLPDELQVDWDAEAIAEELTQATAILSHRGLKLAAKWAAEQMIGLKGSSSSSSSSSHTNMNTTTTTTKTRNAQSQLLLEDLSQMNATEWYAKSLVELGDYLHAASILSPNTKTSSSSSTYADITTIPKTTIEHNTTQLSSFGRFLRPYALFMAGERRKEEEHLEMEGQQENAKQKRRVSRNPYLIQLMEELEEAYQQQEQQLDAFGLYVYGMVLKEGQEETLTCPRPAHTILMESILRFPFNWSAWLDLAYVLSKDSTLEPIVEQGLQPTLATHYMYHFFCAHLMSHHHQSYEDALVLYERLYQPESNAQQQSEQSSTTSMTLFATPYVQSQLGVVHYHLREFEAALEWFHQISDPFLLDDKDIYSNILYVREDKVGLSQLAHQAIRIDKYRPETCCIIGNYYSLKRKRQKAIQYFQRALQLDRSYTSAWTLMGHEYVELKQTESAMEAYRRAVQVSPKDYRAWYGLGQTYEFLNMPLYALFYYRKAATLRPYDARMWCAVGLALTGLHKTTDAIRAYEKAVAQEDTEGIATQKLASLYRQEGRQEEAAQCYVRHLELRYNVVANPLDSIPSLDEIVHGIVVEAPEAEALLFLAQYHKNHREFDTAALFCSRLVEYPGPEKEQAKGLLRDLRSRGGSASASTGQGFSVDATTPTATDSGTPFAETPKASETSTFEFSP